MFFSKMHGLGNDFIVINNLNSELKSFKETAVKLCDRHLGIGADGLLVVEKSKSSDIKMIIINSDGSEAEMCGNGIRCFAKYVYEKGLVQKEKINIETLAGVIVAELKVENNKVKSIRVNMGKPTFEKAGIPFESQQNNMDYEIIVDNRKYRASTMLMGVPHTVIYVDEIIEDEVVDIGKKIEKMNFFPKHTNVNFVRVIDNENIELRTWERGAGLTLACGTGTCASVIACSINHMTNNKVTANLPHGKLLIEYDGTRTFMEGSSEFICEGNV